MLVAPTLRRSCRSRTDCASPSALRVCTKTLSARNGILDNDTPRQGNPARPARGSWHRPCTRTIVRLGLAAVVQFITPPCVAARPPATRPNPNKYVCGYILRPTTHRCVTYLTTHSQRSSPPPEGNLRVREIRPTTPMCSTQANGLWDAARPLPLTPRRAAPATPKFTFLVIFGPP